MEHRNKPQMSLDIVIHSMGLPFNGDTIKTKSLGGSESAAYYQAKELARRGHRVVVFTSDEQLGRGEGVPFDGVLYMHHGQITEACPLGDAFTFHAAKTPHDVLIIQRHPMAFHKDWASKINIWQLHDVATYRLGGLVQGGLPRVDFTTVVSDWHAHQVKTVFGLDDAAIRVVRNGVDPELYAGNFETHPTVAGLKAEGKFVCLYQSRPERGLEHLLHPGGILQKLHEAGSKAHLLVCGYDNTTAQMAPYYQQLAAWGDQLPNVTPLGSLTKTELAQLQRSCDLLLYPTEFAEVSCITAMEAMHAGLPMLTSKYAALAETCAGAGVVLVDLRDGDPNAPALDNLIAGNAEHRIADELAFVRQVQGLEHNPTKLDRLRLKQFQAAKEVTWVKAVDGLEEIIEEAFARRRRPAANLRHLIEHSDIVAACQYADSTAMANAIEEAGRRELIEMYGFIRPGAEPQALAGHYEFWEGKNCDRLAGNGFGDVADEIERFTHTTRFRGILQLAARAIRDAKAKADADFAAAEEVYQAELAEATGLADNEATAIELPASPVKRKVRVLEFGCAHGHVLLPIAKLFPDVEFVGLDFMGKSVKLAFEAAQQFKLGNVTFSQRTQDQLSDDLGQFDCIIAAEVLEHVWDFKAAIRSLLARLTPSGTLVTTTPCGRWEWAGRDYWRQGRQHVHHLEIHDLLELFGPFGIDRNTDVLYAPTEGHDGTGAQVGSWLCAVQNSPGTELGDIDYERKFKYLAPRQTLSLCMIVKDAEGSLRKGLSHVLSWVDQVIIGVDDSTTDDTREVLAKLQREFPQLAFEVFDIESPLKSGFAAARNKTLDKAVGDWVLWMDADEELPYASNIWRLLRPSAFNAYACPQVHYSTAPAQVLTTDYPCRLFRNDRDVRFYGVVHEHPEDVPGKAIAQTMLMGDIQFLHSGYVDENVRRTRYQRNLPLLLRDIEDNPDRYLNKYLLLRDLAQGVGFEASMIGSVNEDMRARARKGIETYNELLDRKNPMLRMIIDALPYYSLCVEVLGIHGSFDAKINLGVARIGTPSMQGEVNTQGRFADRATYRKLLNLIIEESTKHYESKYA